MSNIDDFMKRIEEKRAAAGITSTSKYEKLGDVAARMTQAVPVQPVPVPDSPEVIERRARRAEEAARCAAERAAADKARKEREDEERRAAILANYEKAYRQPFGFSARTHADLAAHRAELEASPLCSKVQPILSTGGMVAMIGPVGTGKTTLAAHFGGWWVKQTRTSMRVAKADDYLTDLRRHTQGFDAPMAVEEWIKRKTDESALLILDEFDKIIALHEGGVQATQAGFWLEAIIDARYGRMDRPTLIVGNFTEDTWAALVPPSIRDRFKVNGARFTIGGKSKRKPTEPTAQEQAPW